MIQARAIFIVLSFAFLSSSSVFANSGSDLGSFGGGVNGFGTLNPMADETGHATFIQHYTDDQPNWQREQEKKRAIFNSVSHHATPPASINHKHSFYHRLMLRCATSGCGRGLKAISAFQTQSTSSKGPAPVAAEGNRFCQKGWWLNSATHLCYSKRKDCLLDGTDVTRSCKLSSR